MPHADTPSCGVPLTEHFGHTTFKGVTCHSPATTYNRTLYYCVRLCIDICAYVIVVKKSIPLHGFTHADIPKMLLKLSEVAV